MKGRRQYPNRKRTRVTRSSRFFPRMLIGMLVFTVLALAYIRLREFIKAEVRQVEKLERTVHKLVEQNKRLQAEQIALSSAERLYRYATEKLNMNEPTTEPVVLFYDDHLFPRKPPQSPSLRENLLQTNPELLAQLIHK
ncbi:hypothetical protein DRQ15_01265 [candidate division KSB1 bacterium]|nr:cell division protein FtsL [bacterium]RKY77335.1 MAG: hypothetical protein DRQ12_08420 [candidate division KSB1 bacterium]RKY88026.1 MAG: hypothetical protein DRQ11_04770 [candidate division KSB1 bacterium]RKY92813.1 MAG: hypothetical protein DRQ15_01265 [candidate division KSB1 bacterium]